MKCMAMGVLPDFRMGFNMLWHMACNVIRPRLRQHAQFFIINGGLTMIRKNVIVTIFFTALSVACAVVFSPHAHSSEMEKIDVTDEPCAIRFILSERVPFKVIRFDRREVLVAFQDVEWSDSFSEKSVGKGCIRSLHVTRTPGGVVSVVITSERDIASISSGWIGEGATLAVSPRWDVKKPTGRPPEKEPAHRAMAKSGGHDGDHDTVSRKRHGNDTAVSAGSKKHAVHETAHPEKEKGHLPAPHGEGTAPVSSDHLSADRKATEHSESGHGEKPHHLPGGHGETHGVGDHGKPAVAEHGQGEKKQDSHGTAVNEHGGENHGTAGKTTHDNQGHGEKKRAVTYDSSHAKALFQGLKNKGGGLKTSDDLYLEIEPQGCEDRPNILKARDLARQGNWSEALEIFNTMMEDPALKPACREYTTLLKAQSYYKEMDEGSHEKDYVKAADHFQDVISFYPQSVYRPFALTSLGKLYRAMGDNNQAEGYYQIVKTTYKDTYPGIPEIMFELGWIYTEKNDAQLAIDTLKDVVARFPEGSFIGKAKLKLGKALFNTGDYASAISIFEELIKEQPEMVLQSSELLLHLGNAYYQTGKPEKAMENLLKVYNLYPDIAKRDTLLTRIGDILVETGHKDKAVKIFKIVTKKFPKTDGFAISTMRLAEYLESPEEKEKMYTQVIDEYPLSPLARLAMMRLAVLQNQNGEYEKSIETVRSLIAMKPRELQKDAVRVLQDSSGYIYKKMFNNDEITELVTQYEADRKYLDDMESPDIFLTAGMAYLSSKLYANAVDTLLKAYNRLGERRRTKELIYSLGVAMDEAERDDEAIEMFAGFLKRFPTSAEVLDVHIRMGRMYTEKNQHTKAVASLKKAYELTADNRSRVRILSDISKNYKELGDYGTAAATLENAAALLSGNPEGNAEELVPVYISLADHFMKMKQWGKASNVLQKALQIGTEPSDLTEIHFMLGESYQHLKKNDEAVGSYTFVADNGDSFWSGMARERLRIMALKDKVEKNQH